MKTKYCLFPGALLFLLAVAVSAQQPAPGFMQGVVTDASNNMPMAKVTIELRNPAGPAALASTITDEAGRFYISKVKPGPYKVVAMRAGFANSEFGQLRPGGPSQLVTVASGQRVSDIRIAMTQAGVISGRILDNGVPVGIADVVAVKVTYIEGQPNFTLVLASRTNDLGEYHLFWLPPGKYLVMGIIWDTASGVPFFMTPDGSNDNTFLTSRRMLRSVFNRASGSGAAENEAHVPFFYPNTPDPQTATVLEIRPGTEIRNADIQATALITKRVKGTINGAIPPLNPAANPAGVPTGPMVRMLPLQSVLNTNQAQSPSVNAEANGSFEIKNVIAGRYLLVATSGSLSGSIPVEVRDRDVDGVSVTLAPGLGVSGQVIVDGPSSALLTPLLSLFRITLRGDPLIPGVPAFTGSATANGAFAIPTPPPNPAAPAAATPPSGMYRVIVAPLLVPPTPPGVPPEPLPPAVQNAYVKSIRLGEIDVLKDGLRLDRTIDDLKIVIGTNPATLDGRVLNDQRQPIASAVVALVPDSSLKYRVNHKWVSSDATGAYQFQSVPPGDYLLFAWESIESYSWQDAGVMRDYESQAKRIHVDEGGKMTTDISAIPRN